MQARHARRPPVPQVIGQFRSNSCISAAPAMPIATARFHEIAPGSSGTNRRCRSRRTSRGSRSHRRTLSRTAATGHRHGSEDTPSALQRRERAGDCSDALNHKSVAQTWTPNSRCRKIDDAAQPQPRSRTRMPGFSSRRLGEPFGEPESRRHRWRCRGPNRGDTPTNAEISRSAADLPRGSGSSTPGTHAVGDAPGRRRPAWI